MRILIAGMTHFCDSPGGAQRIVFDEATELRSQGFEVWVLAQGNASQPEHELQDGIHLLRYVPGRVATWNPARRTVHQKAAAALLAKHLPRVDVIHGHVPLTYLAALDLYGGTVHSCYTIHSPAKLEMAIVWRNSSLLRRLAAPAGLAIIERMERECLRRSRVVTALSQFTIDCIARIHGNGVARSVRLMPGWVDTSKFVPLENRDLAKRQLGWPVDVPVLFTLRRLAPRMGLDRLLHACQRLHSEQIRFHLMIGGTGPIRKDLEELARALGLKDVVTFLGRIADRELPTAYGACDAFVLPTAELECFGLIALEALAAGRPVLATPVGAIPEIIARFQPAWLSRSAKTDDFSDLLRRYFAGALPVRGSAELHDQADREFSRRVRLPNFLESTIGGLSIR